MALAENNSQGGYFRDLNATVEWAGDDNSAPSSSSNASAPYRTGDYVVNSGKYSGGLGTGKLLLLSGVGLVAYLIYKRYK